MAMGVVLVIGMVMGMLWYKYYYGHSYYNHSHYEYAYGCYADGYAEL